MIAQTNHPVRETVETKGILTAAVEPGRQGAAIMLSLAILAALLGAVLGLRFKVPALMPVIVVGLILIIGGALAFGIEFWRTVLCVIVAATALQMGFLGGSGLRFLIAATRVGPARQPSAAAPASRPAH
jgi:hypothetical protein